MKRYLPVMVLMVIFMIATGCSPKVELTNLEKEAADTLKIDEGILKKLKAKPLYQFTENDLDVYLAFCQYTIPDLRDRVQHLARKNIGQTYDIYLLGEFPVEIYDDQPLYNLKNSDCVVFVEHIYAMALSYDWQSFFATLQRIRYRDGIISYAARNHYGDYDWWRSNRWLVKDMTDDLIGAGAVKDTVYVNKTKLFKRRSIPYAVPKDSLVWTYIPLERAEEVMDRLEKGDLVNVVRGYKNSAWVGHFGLVDTDEDGNRYFLHSTTPEVKRQLFSDVIMTGMERNIKKREANEAIYAANETAAVYNDSISKLPEEIRPEFKKWTSPEALLLGYRFLSLKKDPLSNILDEGEVLKLKVVSSPPEAVKSGRRDTVLFGVGQ